MTSHVALLILRIECSSTISSCPSRGWPSSVEGSHSLKNWGVTGQGKCESERLVRSHFNSLARNTAAPVSFSTPGCWGTIYSSYFERRQLNPSWLLCLRVQQQAPGGDRIRDGSRYFVLKLVQLCRLGPLGGTAQELWRSAPSGWLRRGGGGGGGAVLHRV